MPELPEVETIVRRLAKGAEGSPAIIGYEIVNSKVLWHKTLATPSAKTASKRIIGQTVKNVTRRGKYIQIHLTEDYLLIHLRMSGDIIIGNGKKPLGSHPRYVLYFNGDLQLSFTDARKFGRVWLVQDLTSVTSKLGPEPLASDFYPDDFTKMLHSHKRQIKPLLLDQSFIAGIGNIYADESLHLSKIHPQTRSNDLSTKQSESLYYAIRKVLQLGIDSNGASIDWVYRGGDYQNNFRAYGRSDEPCIECGTIMIKTIVAQRGTFLCPTCQILPIEK